MIIYRIAVDYERLPLEPESDWDEETSSKVDEAMSIFDLSGVRPNFSKDVSNIALQDGTVVGVVTSEWRSGEGNVAQFSFDIAVHPEYRNLKIGTKLIERAVSQFESERHDYEEAFGRAEMFIEVINLRLSDFLIRDFGFEVVRELKDRVYLRKS
ncbi:MAG: GNAT family N-acetyltransferase [Synergistaceae bacterium]